MSVKPSLCPDMGRTSLLQHGILLDLMITWYARTVKYYPGKYARSRYIKDIAEQASCELYDDRKYGNP